jgi:transcription initiation factor TFIID subunit 6
MKASVHFLFFYTTLGVTATLSMPPRNDSSMSSLPRAQGSSNAFSVYPTDTVQDVAESLGLPPLNGGVAALLAADVEYRIRQVVQDASKFMRHGKRTQLRVTDVDRALRQRNIEPIFGFHPTTLGKASASGAYPTPVGSTFRRIQTQSGPIHLVADEEIDLDKVLDVSPRVALSHGVGWSAHWLAIEGVQPAIPQNPTFVAASNAVISAAAPAAVGSNMVQPGGATAFLASSSAGSSSQPVAKALIKHVLSRELQLYFERLTTAIIEPPREANVEDASKRQSQAKAVHKGTETPKAADADGDTSMASNAGPTGAGSAPESGLPASSGNSYRDAALSSLRADPGLHQLVPYLIQWINERIQTNLRDEDVLGWMLHTIDALITNPYLGIEPYVHQLLPYVLSILLTASLGQSPTSERAYMLRSQAGSVLARIVKQYTATYPTLLPRIVRTLIGALGAGCARATRLARGESVAEMNSANGEDRPGKGPRDSASTKLGAIIGLRCLGAGCVRSLLVVDQESTGDDSCHLSQLGYWCQAAAQDASRAEELSAIDDELNVAFAEVSSSLRGDIPLADAEKALGAADVEQWIGTHWVNVLSKNSEAARGLLALLSEVKQLQQK